MQLPSLAEVKLASTVEEAINIQNKIAPLVCIPQDEKDGEAGITITRVLALDVAYSTRSDLAVASGVLYHLEKQEDVQSRIIAETVFSGRVSFPYQAGLLAFREIPLLEKVIDTLLFSTHPSIDDKSTTVLLCDGAGIAHPRHCGIASHIGIFYQCAAIGVAKNHLIGDFDDSLLKPERGSHSMLSIEGKAVGTVLRSQSHIRPIFVSPGHLISISQASQLVLQLCQKYRLPEPIRRSDHIGRMELKRLEEEEEGIEIIAKPNSTSFIHGQQDKEVQKHVKDRWKKKTKRCGEGEVETKDHA